jgi:branched-subunit amino acid ABC-type transport system permease component
MFGQVVSAIIDGVTSGATLFLVAVGLSLIFGVLKVLNAAHGSFYAIGAFTAAWTWGLIGAIGVPHAFIYPGLFLSALVVGVVLGPPLERLLLRWTFDIEPATKRENLQLLATFAAFLILEDGQKLVFWYIAILLRRRAGIARHHADRWAAAYQLPVAASAGRWAGFGGVAAVPAA